MPWGLKLPSLILLQLLHCDVTNTSNSVSTSVEVCFIACRSSVVDPSGQCWDVSGLFVADASLFPTASGVNPMITVYGLSHMVAAGIAKRWKETNRLAKLVKNTNNEKDVQAARDQTDNV